MQLLDIPKTTRPREKLLKMGSHTLTDAELLAIMLGTGLPGQNVLQLAQALLDDFHGLAGLLKPVRTICRRPKAWAALQDALNYWPYLNCREEFCCKKCASGIY